MKRATTTPIPEDVGKGGYAFSTGPKEKLNNTVKRELLLNYHQKYIENYNYIETP
jgi:hypothetical protein